MKRRFIVPILAAVTIGVVTLGTPVTYATSSQGQQTIIQKIAQKFGLKEEEVKAVFEEEKNARKAEMEGKFAAYLDQAIQDGKITEAQKQLILTKRSELQSWREQQMVAFKDQSPEERKSAQEAHHAELKAWANANNIDLKYLMGHGGKMTMKGNRGGWKR